MSFVESWPSTVMRSIEPARPRRRASPGSSTTPSVWTKQSMVANPGWIIPAPLAWAERVTPPARRVQRLGPRSVVMIATANSSPPSSLRSRAACSIPAVTALTSSGTPIVPVSAIATAAGSRPSAEAAASRISTASRKPCSPVAALALPELTATARIPPASHPFRQTLMGAAAAAFAVRASAERTASWSQTSRPTSVSPPPLMPQATPDARNPGASWAGSSSSTPSGGWTQRLLKNVSVAPASARLLGFASAAALTRSPPPPAAPASG